MTDLDLIAEAALEAGRLALALRDQGLQIWYKEGVSPVTNGDLAVDALLRTRLMEARPDYGWLSEETIRIVWPPGWRRAACSWSIQSMGPAPI